MTDYTLCFWKFSALVPFKSRQDIYFHSLQRSPEWKWNENQGLFASSVGRKCCSWKGAQIPSWQLAMKTPILMYFDKQSSRPDSLLPQSIGTMHTEILRSLKRIANEKQSGSEKKPQSHVGSHWSSSEVRRRRRGVWQKLEHGCEGVSLTQQHSVSKAGEASFRACYPSCPLAWLSSGSASHRCCHHHNFQSTFWLQNSRVGVCVCVCKGLLGQQVTLMKASVRGRGGRNTNKILKVSHW